jgi:flagellar motility protein MotE (MotC chaperone)
MKNIIVIVGGVIGSFVLVMGIGVGLLYMKPDLFVSMPQGGAIAKDSTIVKTDSLVNASADTAHVAETEKSKEQRPRSGLDSLLVTKLTEKAHTLELVVDSLKKQAPVPRSKPDSSGQSDWKSTAKLIESMSPEDAGKVLKQMSDAEVKQVISKVKTKQAGKILANLEPDRVARILR